MRRKRSTDAIHRDDLRFVLIAPSFADDSRWS